MDNVMTPCSPEIISMPDSMEIDATTMDTKSVISNMTMDWDLIGKIESPTKPQASSTPVNINTFPATPIPLDKRPLFPVQLPSLHQLLTTNLNSSSSTPFVSY